jgi:hypothetical protein
LIGLICGFVHLLSVLPHTLALEITGTGTVRLYRLKKDAELMIELAILPRLSGRLEVRMARLRSGSIYEFAYKVHAYHSPWVSYEDAAELPGEVLPTGENYCEFCTAFYAQVAQDFEIDFGSQPGYPQGVVEGVALACLAQTHVEHELRLELSLYEDHELEGMPDDGLDLGVDLDAKSQPEHDAARQNNVAALPDDFTLDVDDPVEMGRRYVVYEEAVGVDMVRYFQDLTYDPEGSTLLDVLQTFSLGINASSKQSNDPWILPPVIAYKKDLPNQAVEVPVDAERPQDAALDIVLSAWYQQKTQYYLGDSEKNITLEEHSHNYGCSYADVQDYTDSFDVYHPEYRRAMEAAQGKTKRGPIQTTTRLFQVVKRLKHEHPEWSRHRMRQEINKIPGYEHIDEEGIRNVYRARNEPWERSKRIR